jgi:pyruvyltransferase
MSIPTSDKLYYWGGHGNFGDELSLYLVEKISGRKYRHADKYANGKLVAVGSLLTPEIMRTDSRIWGTGTLTRHALDPERTPWFPLNRKFRAINPRGRRAKIFAIRGPLTRESILHSGFDCPEIYGDPAILMPRYFSPSSTKRYPIGLILHHSQPTPSNAEAWLEHGIKLIPIQREGNAQIEAFVNDVHACEKVLSTSLHGLIIAQCYGVPVRWVAVGSLPIHEDAEHKFLDYFLGAGQTAQEPETIRLDPESIASTVERTTMPRILPFTMAKRLLDAFPD